MADEYADDISFYVAGKTMQETVDYSLWQEFIDKTRLVSLFTMDNVFTNFTFSKSAARVILDACFKWGGMKSENLVIIQIEAVVKVLWIGYVPETNG